MHEHEHTHTETVTETVAPPVQEETPTSNLEKYIKDHPMDLSVFKSMNEVNSDFRSACRRIAEDFQRNYETVNTRTQWYVHLARKKLHQGKKWSKGLVDALLVDLNVAREKYIQQQMEQVSNVSGPTEATTSADISASTTDTPISTVN